MALDKKLHILFLCGWYPSRVSPNNGDFIQRHAEAVSSQHKVTVMHIISDEKAAKNIEVSSSKINNLETHIAYIKKYKNPFLKAFLFYKTFNSLLKQIENFDIVHLNEIYPFGVLALYLNLFRKKKFIISEHWTGYLDLNNNKIPKIHLFFARKIIKRASFVCPVSQELKKGMQNLDFIGNYEIVPNVVNTNFFHPTVKKEVNDVFNIIHISSMNDKHKNVSGILKAASKLNFDYKLVLIGENPDKFSSIIKELNIENKVELVNQISHKEIASFLQKSDLYISFSNYETWGIVMIEAISCGVPVISTKTGVLHEMKESNYTEYVNFDDINALKNTITNIKNSERHNSDNMHTWVKSLFSNEIVSSQFSNLYYKSLN